MYKSILLLFLGVSAFAQQRASLTGVRDTSFTVSSAFRQVQRDHPAARIAEPVLPANVLAKTNIAYCSYGNRTLYLDAFYPAAHSPKIHPAVLLIHGGGWRSGDRSQQIPMAQQLAVKGYVAVTAEYQLSSEALYPAAVHDLKAAIRWLRAHASEFNIDTTRIAVLGFSAGGQLAALLGTTGNLRHWEGQGCHQGHSSAVQAVVDIDGILAFIHPESGEGDDSKRTSAATHWFGFSKTQNPALWQEASALSHVDIHTPPILFLNSSVPRMHAGRDDMIGKLNALNIYSEVHTFEDAPHTFSLFHPWFEPTVNLTVKFLDQIFGE
jgi:pectinesterase